MTKATGAFQRGCKTRFIEQLPSIVRTEREFFEAVIAQDTIPLNNAFVPDSATNCRTIPEERMDILKDNAEPSLMLKQGEIAALFKIGRRTLWRWISTGQFPPPDLREGRIIRWNAATVVAWAHGRKPIV